MNLIFDEDLLKESGISALERDKEREEILFMMKKAAVIALEKEGIADDNIEISISFVTKDEIRELNRVYRSIDKVTDVLSFPQFESVKDFASSRSIKDGEEKRRKQVKPLLLGDVVICLDLVNNQAEEYGHSFEREFLYLFIHSLAHLLGYDHLTKEEKAEMREFEEEILGLLYEYIGEKENG